MYKIKAIFKKEISSELRSPQSFFINMLFNFLAVVAVSFASYGQQLNPTVSAGLLSIILLFSAVITSPKVFLVEDEQNTFDLLRLFADPLIIFFGKVLYSFLQLLLTGFLLSVFALLFMGAEIVHWPLMLGSILVECFTLCIAICICSAMAMGSSQRWHLTITLALPLLLPQIAMSIGALRVSLGIGSLMGGVQNLIGLVGFAITLLAISPLIISQLWSKE